MSGDEDKTRLAAAHEVALILMKHGVQLVCLSKWGVPSSVVLRVMHVNGEFHIGWRSQQNKHGLSLKYILDVTPGVRIEIRDAKPPHIEESKAFAVVFRPAHTLQFCTEDEETTQQLVNCILMLTREVKKASTTKDILPDFEEKLQFTAYQISMKQEELVQWDTYLRRQDAAAHFFRIVQKKCTSSLHNRLQGWINYMKEANNEKMLSDKKRWRLHAIANADADLQAWYHAMFCDEVYRLRGAFWHREASLAPYKKQLAVDSVDIHMTPLEEVALANVLCTPETTYGDVAGQLYVAKYLLPENLFKVFQTLAAQGYNITKHPRNGRPSKKPFRLSFVEGRIFLTWKGRYGNQGIALAEVDNIQNGLHTDILKRTGRAARADVYLSLLCPFRTLDLCFESVEERETWQELLEQLVLKEKGELPELKIPEMRTKSDGEIDALMLLGHK